MSLPSVPWLLGAMQWFHPTEHSACLLIFVLVRSLRGVLGEALHGHGRHSPIAPGELQAKRCSPSPVQAMGEECWFHHPAPVAQSSGCLLFEMLSCTDCPQ